MRYINVNNISQEAQGPETVRVYRSSPETVTLQIRGLKRYATVRLTFQEACDIAEALRQETLEHRNKIIESNLDKLGIE